MYILWLVRLQYRPLPAKLSASIIVSLTSQDERPRPTLLWLFVAGNLCIRSSDYYG